MLDYNPDEETLKNDKKKIAILISIIVFVVILIVLFIVVVILDINNTDQQKKYSTTTRRTVSIEESSSNNEENNNEIIEEIDITSTTSTMVKSTNKTNISSNGTTSKKVVEVFPPSITHETTNGKSIFPNSLDDWEWEIVNLINKERKKNGLSELLVAKDLRQLAEEAADLWGSSEPDDATKVLTGHSYYRKYSNYDDVNSSSFYEDTIVETKVTTISELRYLGVGVIYKNNTYYYVIIYE